MTKSSKGGAVREVRRAVGYPYSFVVCVHVDGAGDIDAVGVDFRDDVTDIADLLIRRANLHVSSLMRHARKIGLLASDVLTGLPLVPELDLERVILREVAAVQMLSARGAAGMLNACLKRDPYQNGGAA
ncbi:hypothetical protein Q1W73_16585 [Asticcacaulis sp. ZE23SCel15]|uniref:hypothetical protein n=1 Tax=Asticcacaulis sp. ZE23SCel15 TaxID=3059027 RepID=UPI00265F5F8A|nr:hypothetical protein [Asticcacaulis sp. ZE23SCel15]WKL57261.1 hypothetical protein Q1W73_16585 [Asticcacaulis sp. ZE23SCel15]